MPFKVVLFSSRTIRRLPLLPAAQQAAASAVPQDRVTISSAALAKSSGSDKDHDHDSK
jgi:hypothetical protein